MMLMYISLPTVAMPVNYTSEFRELFKLLRMNDRNIKLDCEVRTRVSVKNAVFWGVMPCNLVFVCTNKYAWCLQLRGGIV
jgi:hypothetical protein